MNALEKGVCPQWGTRLFASYKKGLPHDLVQQPFF